jgi:hypothetical protein
MRLGPIWVTALAGLLLAGRAHGAGSPRIALVLRGAPQDEEVAELMARVRGELRAARFEVDESAAPGTEPPREIVERESRRPGISAAMGIFLDRPDAEIWVADARSTRAIIATVAPGTDGDLRALAAKAVDLLKAVLADVPPAEPAPLPPVPATPPTVVAAPVAPPPPPPARDRILMAGVGWLRAGDAQTVAPLLELSLVGRHLGARVTASGLGSSTELSATAGTASVGQHLALIELLGCLRPRARLLACGSAGGGAELLTIHGAGYAGYQGNDSALWSAVGAVGAGLSWMPARWLAFSVEARGLGAWPTTQVRIDGTVVARAGGPGVWVTAGVGARL